MSNKDNVRRVFPGGNTYKGFYSYYDYILDQKDAKRIMILKGGPGVGKSSFMKKLGEAMLEKGFEVEYHHCSSDNNSVDGVVFPEVGVALMDGTAPHIVDPKNPGAVDEIIHLGDYWNEVKMMENKDVIIKDNREVGRQFRRAYGYLAAAKGAYDNLITNLDAIIDYAKLNKIANEIIKQLFSNVDIGDVLGIIRHLFGSAITPDGVKDHLETLFGPIEIIIVIRSKYNHGHSKILEKIGESAVERGYDVEYFHNHFIPEKVDNIIIKDLSVAITTSDKFDDGINKVYDIDECYNSRMLKKREEEIKLDAEAYEQLINLAVSNISKAKKVHDRMENYYIPNIDFNAIDELTEKTLLRILNWYKEKK